RLLLLEHGARSELTPLHPAEHAPCQPSVRPIHHAIGRKSTMTVSSSSRISAVHPLWAVEGGRVTITGSDFVVDPVLPSVLIGGVPARLSSASPTELSAIVPAGLDGGRTPVRVQDAPGETAFVEIGAPLATGLHQVDSPAFDADGNLYV